MKIGARFNNLLEIKCAKFYSDLTFYCRGLLFFRTQCGLFSGQKLHLVKMIFHCCDEKLLKMM